MLLIKQNNQLASLGGFLKTFKIIIILIIIISISLFVSCGKSSKITYERVESFNATEQSWFEQEYNENNALHKGIVLMKENYISTHRSDLSIVTQPSFSRFLLPAGVEYLDEMIEMAVDRRLFSAETMSAIGIIANVLFIEDVAYLTDYPMSVDDGEGLQQLWIQGFSDMMKELHSLNIDINRMDQYGVFVLPYIRDNYDTDPEYFGSYINTRFNKETFAGFKTAASAKSFFRKNKQTINMLEEIIDKYGK